MSRAILASFLVLAATVGLAQDDWSYPVDPYYGILHESEYPGDAFPVDVNVLPKTVTSPSPVRMGDPDAPYTYWPEPTYYWWDALTGPGILHGAWPSTAMARYVRECRPDICTQTTSPEGTGGFIQFVFADTTQNVRIRLVRFGEEHGEDGFQMGAHWQEGLVRVPADAFILEHGVESSTCGAYDFNGDDSLSSCRVYQVVVPPVPDSTNVLYGKCFPEMCSVLKVSSTADAVTFYPRNAPSSEDDESTVEPAATPANSIPVVVSQLADTTVTEGVSVNLAVSSSFEDADGDSLAFAATGLPDSLDIDAVSGMISGTPTALEVNKQFEVTVTATDTAGASVSDSFNISVAAAPKPAPAAAPPVASPSGGGGSLAPTMLLLLALVSILRSRRRRIQAG